MKNLKYLLIVILFSAFAGEGFGQCIMSPPIVTNVSCNGTNDGVISFILQCPSNATFLWNDNSTVGIPRTGLSAGTYSVTITDNLGVTIHNNILVNQYQITYNVSQQNNPCLNVCEGSATVNPSSPSGVSYLWSNGATTNQINNLCDGTYSVTITKGVSCTEFHTFVITTDPLLNQNWQKNTMNVAQQNDNIKKVLTDDVGNMYVMGEFEEATEIEGNFISSGGISNQKGIFLVKYSSCGFFEWMVHMENNTSFYDIDAFDLDFNDAQTEIVIFAKWNNNDPSLSQNYEWFSSNGSSFQTNNSSTAEDVFTAHVNTSTANFAAITDYELGYNDTYTSGKDFGGNMYFAGQIGSKAEVQLFANGLLSHKVIADQNSGNIVADFEVHEVLGITYVYAAVNLLASGANLDPFFTTYPGFQGDALIVKAPVDLVFPYQQQSPSDINFANGSSVLIHDLEVDVTSYMVMTAVGEYTGNVLGWVDVYSPPAMNIKTALVAQFSANNLANYGVHHMDGNIDESTAIAVSMTPNYITVTGTMDGNDADFIGDLYRIHNNTGSGFGLNSMWVAQFTHPHSVGLWFIGSQSIENMSVNDISYNDRTKLFYVGGNYQDELNLPPYTTLPFPTPGSGQELGYIVRGGEDTPGQGAYYKTSAPNSSEQENTVLGVDLSQIKVYPNPNNGAFTLEFKSNSTENMYVKIFSITGSIVFNNTIEKTNSIVALQIQPTNMSSGLYTIQIIQGDNISYKKFTVK